MSEHGDLRRVTQSLTPSVSGWPQWSWPTPGFPFYRFASVKGMMALAVGSTIAGNLFILGAASNVVIIQNAKKKSETLTYAASGLWLKSMGLPTFG